MLTANLGLAQQHVSLETACSCWLYSLGHTTTRAGSPSLAPHRRRGETERGAAEGASARASIRARGVSNDEREDARKESGHLVI